MWGGGSNGCFTNNCIGYLHNHGRSEFIYNFIENERNGVDERIWEKRKRGEKYREREREIQRKRKEKKREGDIQNDTKDREVEEETEWDKERIKNRNNEKRTRFLKRKREIKERGKFTLI